MSFARILPFLFITPRATALLARLARTPSPPYYAVIFTSQRTDVDRGYDQMAERMVALAFQMSGFLVSSQFRGADGLGITVSYWESEDAIQRWKEHSEHKLAQEAGKKVCYADYILRVAKVERACGTALTENKQ